MRLIRSSAFKDEQCSVSSARLLLWLWTGVIVYVLVQRPHVLTNAVLAFLSGVYTALVCWATGPRLAQYVAPQLAGMLGAIGQAKAVTVSTDVQEIRKLLNRGDDTE